MALQWRQPPNALKAAKTLGEMLITLALNYASPLIFNHETPPNHNNRSRASGGVWVRIPRGFEGVLYCRPNRVWCITRVSLNIVRQGES